MTTLPVILIDDSIKPPIEWIDGKAVQKPMPTAWHAFLQLAIAQEIKAWAKVHGPATGKVGTEWRFTIPPNAYKTESLVPDVAYLASYFDLSAGDRKYSNVPPDIAVEILSPADSASDVAAKRRFFMWWGIKLVLIFDPATRTVELHETGRFATFGEDDTFASHTFPSLNLPLRAIFAEIDEPT